MDAKLHKDKIIITFRYNPVLVEKIRTLEGRRWNSKKREWSCNATQPNLKKLKEWGFGFSKKLRKLRNEFIGKQKHNDIMEHWVGPPLRPFQTRGVNLIQQKAGRVLLADEMGLGKTVQALAWLALNPSARPAVIACPSSMKLHWRRLARVWSRVDKCIILQGRSPYKIPEGSIIIVNYDILDDWIPALLKLSPKVFIPDECHKLKNPKAKRTKASRRLAKRTAHIIAISGTPIQNKPGEFFSIINMVNKMLFPSQWDFRERFCGLKHNGFGWVDTRPTNTKELHSILTRTIMIRRLKKNVLKELPPKQRIAIPLEINKTKYNKAMEDLTTWLKENPDNNAEAMVRIGKTKLAVVKAKLPAVIDWVDGFLEKDNKLIVYAYHKEIIDALMQHYGRKAVKVDGSVRLNDRQRAINAFANKKDVKLFIANIEAGEGLDGLQGACSATCTIEFRWSPGVHVQAEDRVHRDGQESDSVNSYYLVVEDTIEETIAALIDRKARTLSELLDGKEVNENELITELLDKIKNENKH